MTEKHPVNSPIAGLFVDSSKEPQLEVSPAINTVPPEPNRLHTFPDGGLKAYLTVLGAFIALMCTSGQTSAFGTFQAWYASHQLQHVSASMISWIGTLDLFLFFFTGALIGRLFDAYGPTRLMTIGTLCCFTGTMTTSVCKEYYQFILSQGILFGLGSGLLFYPSFSSIPTHFSKYRATALGIAVAGSSLGGVIYPIILQALFTKVGFPWGVRIIGFINTLGCIAATLMVTSLCNGPKETGPYFDINVIADTQFILLALGSSLVYLGLIIPAFYSVVYAKYLSIPEHITSYVLAVLNAAGILGRIVPAYLSDSIGRFNLLIPSAFFTGLSCLVIWLFAKSLVSLMVFAVIYGFISGAFVSLVSPCVAQISRIEQMGTRIGVLYTSFSFPSLVGGPIAGALLARDHGSFTAMIVFSGVTMITGSFFLLASKLIHNSLFARV